MILTCSYSSISSRSFSDVDTELRCCIIILAQVFQRKTALSLPGGRSEMAFSKATMA